MSQHDPMSKLLARGRSYAPTYAISDTKQPIDIISVLVKETKELAIAIKEGLQYSSNALREGSWTKRICDIGLAVSITAIVPIVGVAIAAMSFAPSDRCTSRLGHMLAGLTAATLMLSLASVALEGVVIFASFGVAEYTRHLLHKYTRDEN